MKQVDVIIKKRNTLLKKLTSYKGAVSGNIYKGAVSPGSDKSYWRITWKENQKTKILYVRPDEQLAFSEGIKQYAQMKTLLKQIGDLNRTLILLQRKND